MTGERFQLPDDDLVCVNQVEIITDYLEGALPEAERRRLEAHIAICPGCTEYLAQMRALAGGLGELREDAIPGEMRNAVLDAFRDRPRG